MFWITYSCIIKPTRKDRMIDQVFIEIFHIVVENIYTNY